ncbi:MAG: hypothetical protein S4CHLAM20_03990 [Chlamydiia bacterium]|nr:hypothetical protein [Chlamydiia bacterium]
MSKHTKNEFRALCGGISRSNLNTYISRKKVKVGRNKLIDDQVYENNIFVLSFQEKNGGAITLDELAEFDKPKKKVIEKEESEVVDTPKKTNSSKTVIEVPSRKPKTVNKKVNEPVYESGSVSQMDREKRQIDLQRAKEELEIKILQKKKLMGEVIPVDMVIGVFTRHFKNVTDLYYSSSDTLITEISHRFKLNREETGGYRKRLVELINEVTRESMEISKKEIQSIVDDFSQTRSVGQRK